MKKSSLITAVSCFLLLLSGCGGNENIPDTNKPDKPDKADTLSYNLEIFPEGSQPAFIGAKLSERFIAQPHSFWGNVTNGKTADHVTYPDVCAWLGALWFAQSVEDYELYNRLANKFDLLFTTEKHLQPNLNTSASNKVDYYVFGAVPLEIYKRRKENKYLELGMKYADGQWTLPSGASQTEKDWHNDGYSWQTRLWIDDMFMITALQAHAYLATGNEKYIDRTAREMVLYLERLQRDNGLFYHAPSAPFFWGRGNGWMAVGMSETLRMLPEDAKYDEYRNKIMEGYLKMMSGLYRYQMSDGMWGQLIDDLSSWKETSGTAMFTYAMITGVKKGWLDEKKYGVAARKAWLSLLTYLTTDYDITNVCEGTGTNNSYSHYINRKKLTGDMHGQAALLWCSYALSLPAKGN
ncbi:MAG: glycoside hydrolase family 88 protein [Candidatus Symbiothrix sp.]|jgi:rhamnogalacturonyl hydrolase YesR|nr:glycoside hydrolase family 88 protein [Candidatus Symbiothrix sp.]